MAPNQVFRGNPFEQDSLPLDSAEKAFEWLVTGPDPLWVDGRFFPGLPRRRVPLDELRGLLLDTRLPLPAVDLIWMHLVTRSRDEGGAWTVACVGVALPALFAITLKLSARFADDHHDLHAAVLTGFLSELASMNLARPWILWRLRCAALRAGHVFIRDALERPAPTDEDFHSSEPTRPWGHPDLVLARAVAEGAITSDEAELIGATRLEDYTLEAAAADTGISVTALHRARAHAEQRLLTWLTEQAAHDHAGDAGDPGQCDVETHALNNAAITTAATRIHPLPSSRPVTDVAARFSITVRYRAGKKRSEYGVGGCGRTPAAPAHTPSPTRPADTPRRPPTTTPGTTSSTTSEVPRCA